MKYINPGGGSHNKVEVTHTVIRIYSYSDFTIVCVRHSRKPVQEVFDLRICSGAFHEEFCLSEFLSGI